MKPDSSVVSIVIAVVTSGALATLMTQLVRGWGSLKKGARASTRAVINDMAEDRQSAEDRLEHMTRVAEHWRALAGNYNYQLRANGITPDPENPIPPSAAVREGVRVRKRVRELEDTLSRQELDE